MDQIVDWSKGEYKVVYSDLFDFFRGSAVTIYKKHADEWEMAIADMSPSILSRCKFPKVLCRAAAQTSKDQQSRVVKNGKIEVVTDLYVPPPKPQLYVPK
jgi:hypothetical protein